MCSVGRVFSCSHRPPLPERPSSYRRSGFPFRVRTTGKSWGGGKSAMELGGSQYGSPSLPPPQQLVAGCGSGDTAEAASHLPQPCFKELVIGNDYPERGGAAGNRWPRQETLALLKIRSELDSSFREASLKAPLWEDVSRRLGEQGYRRSSKKCKEKFENVHKYYKRTKEGRAGGRHDGRSYRFFTQLEALHTVATAAANDAPAIVHVDIASSSKVHQASPISSAPPLVAPTEVSFSSSSTSSSSSGGDDESLSETRKRKRSSGGKMIGFLEGLMKQVMERQEAMQQQFLETIEKREQEMTAREDAWRKQETARLSQEHHLIAQERAIAASRDATIIAFLQKITGQSIHLPQPSPPPPPVQQPRPPPVQQQQQQHQSTQLVPFESLHRPTALALADAIAGPSSSSSSRWPKPEVHALINLRSRLEGRYQEAGPKGPLWDEISSEMEKLGYLRSSKRCKEKWENINKYFKKVKESNKKRPEDSKTCPYFHLLDALHLKRISGQRPQLHDPPPPSLPLPLPPSADDTEVRSTSIATADDINDTDNDEEEEDNGIQYKIQFSNVSGGVPAPATASSSTGSFLALVSE